MNDSEKEYKMSQLRSSYEKMKKTKAYAELPQGAKDELEKAVTEFEFAIQTEYEDCRRFILGVLNEGEVDDFEALLDDDATAPVVRAVTEQVASVFRAMVSTLLVGMMEVAAHCEKEHGHDSEPYLELGSQFSKSMMVVDSVFSDLTGDGGLPSTMKWGVARRDQLGEMMRNPMFIIEEDEEE